ASSIIQANLSIRIPAGMLDPSAEIKHAPRHGAGMGLLSFALPIHDRIGKFNAQSFVRIDTQDPIVASLLGSKILLFGVSLPGMFDHARTQRGGDLPCPVRASRIDNDHFVAA